MDWKEGEWKDGEWKVKESIPDDAPTWPYAKDPIHSRIDRVHTECKALGRMLKGWLDSISEDQKDCAMKLYISMAGIAALIAIQCATLIFIIATL